MAERCAHNSELRSEPFVCRPRKLQSFFRLRYQGTFPPSRWTKRLVPIVAVTSPLSETILLAGLPMISLIFLFELVPGLQAPHQPFWVRPLCFAVLVISCPGAVWWYWISPRYDSIAICDGKLRWRLSFSCWEWFRASGSLPLDTLSSFSYRSDGLEPEASNCGKSTEEKFARLLLEINLSRHDLALHLKSGKTIVLEKLLARFETDDLRLLFDRLGVLAERQEIQM